MIIVDKEEKLGKGRRKWTCWNRSTECVNHVSTLGNPTLYQREYRHQHVSLQNSKQKELAQLRTAEEQQLATAVLDQYSKERRELGEIADLHSRHDVLREYEPREHCDRAHNCENLNSYQAEGQLTTPDEALMSGVTSEEALLQVFQ